MIGSTATCGTVDLNAIVHEVMPVIEEARDRTRVGGTRSRSENISGPSPSYESPTWATSLPTQVLAHVFLAWGAGTSSSRRVRFFGEIQSVTSRLLALDPALVLRRLRFHPP